LTFFRYPHDSEPAYHSVDAFPSSLTSLNITANQITNRGAYALAAALAQNSCIQTLICGSNVFGNSIGDEGAAALAQALKVCLFLSIHISEKKVFFILRFCLSVE
jgi:hypothetical protein